MADAFAITMLHIAAVIIIPGCWVLYGGLFPDAVERGRERLQRMPFKTFFLGFGISAFVGLLAAVLGGAGLQAPAGILLGGLALWGLFGASPFARLIGNRLSPKSDAPWKSHALGGVFLVFPWMLFPIGELFFMPLTLVIGVGSGTLALFKRHPAPAAAAPAPATAPAKQEQKVEATA